MTVTAYKGFDQNLRCRGFQYEVGQTYAHDGDVVMCMSGFHACEYPLDVFTYYPPARSRYAVVTLDGEICKDEDDSKIAGAKLTVEAELQLPDLIDRAVKWVFDNRSNSEDNGSRATGYQSAALATGYHSAALATGDRSAVAATGEQSAASATGFQSAASVTGFQSAASVTGIQSAALATGDHSAALATRGYSAALATGDHSAALATRGYSAALATGGYSAASVTGIQSAALATGIQSAASVTGDHSAALATGYAGKAMGAEGCALFLVYRKLNREIKHVWAGIAGKNGIKPLTWYTLDASGQPVEIEARR